MFQKTSRGDTFKPIREMHVSGPLPIRQSAGEDWSICSHGTLGEWMGWPGVDMVSSCGQGGWI